MNSGSIGLQPETLPCVPQGSLQMLQRHVTAAVFIVHKTIHMPPTQYTQGGSMFGAARVIDSRLLGRAFKYPPILKAPSSFITFGDSSADLVHHKVATKLLFYHTRACADSSKLERSRGTNPCSAFNHLSLAF